MIVRQQKLSLVIHERDLSLVPILWTRSLFDESMFHPLVSLGMFLYYEHFRSNLAIVDAVINFSGMPYASFSASFRRLLNSPQDFLFDDIQCQILDVHDSLETALEQWDY